MNLYCFGRKPLVLFMIDRIALLRGNWYNAALFFLHQADFLRLLDVRNIQTISILGSVFSNFGDINLYYNLLGCAVRIGESLGINNDYTHFTGILPDLQSQRCLWWPLVILDWPNFLLGQPCISDNDFIVEIPSVGSSSGSESDWDLRNYQAMMCKIALLLYRFQATICASMDWETVENAVVMADEKLVNLMKELSPYTETVGLGDACMGMDKSDAADFSGSIQRQNLLLILFYYRILINRTLIRQSPSLRAKETLFLRCSKSAHNIIKVCMAMDNTGQLVATWYVLLKFVTLSAYSLTIHRSTFLPLYSAANILAVYGARCHCELGHDHIADVTASIQMFDSLSHKSVFGEYAARKLRQITQNLTPG